MRALHARACAAFAFLAALGVVAAALPARALASACPDISGPKCTIQLSTGITMRYLEVGPSDGPAVFLLHGYTDSSRSMSLVMRDLHQLAPQLDIIAPDQRGHGASSLPTDANCPAAPGQCFRPIDFAHDLVAFMDARDIRRASVIGHSMGSLVAQELGLSYPDRINRLVLISTGASGQVPAVESLWTGLVEGEWQTAFTGQGYQWPAGVYTLSPAVAAPGFDDFLQNSWDADAIAPQSFLDQIIPETRATQLGTWIGALQNLVEADNAERLRHLTVPTFVLWATQDFVFSRADQQTVIDSLTAAAHAGGSFWWKQYGTLPTPATGEQTDLGHNIVWEAPQAVATDIASYLEHGHPTKTLYHANYPTDIHQIVAEPGHAVLIHAGQDDGAQ
jgi:pimeloyl-ACP methyl ester carboxylesterase